MKKLLLGIAALGILASCNVKNSDEYKALQAEKDSLLRITNEGQNEVTDLMALINEVNLNFDQIREAEKYLNLQVNGKGELSADAKTQIKDNFQMINDILAKNKADIETLNKKIRNSGGQASKLKETIDRLNIELEARSTAIVELQDALVTRDAQIASLTGTVNKLSADVQDLAIKTYEQENVIQEQDAALNTGYYIFGTSKELKEKKLVSGGLISSNKILAESIDKSIFIKVDIRKTNQIDVYAKKVKILTNQPKDSYTIVKNDKGQAVIKILDYRKFWSLGQYLVMEVSL